MADFPTSVNVNPAIGLPGDFASVNPRHSVVAPPGGFSAGPNGLTIGLACWADSATGQILSNSGSGLPTGILHRNMQALITTYLTTYGYTIPAGFAVGELFDNGDLFVKNFGSSAVAVGMKAFANTTNGTWSFAAAGTTVSGSVETGWYAKLACAAGEITIVNKLIPG
jgi:hypothetical protein